jgi:hypothetical protein
MLAAVRASARERVGLRRGTSVGPRRPRPLGMLRVVIMRGIGSALNYQAGGFGSPAAAFWSGTQNPGAPVPPQYRNQPGQGGNAIRPTPATPRHRPARRGKRAREPPES